ncbi:hybrid-cluster NAD(P)-dependent oxidoreductase [Shewanella sp. Scap07]|uniref:hybrid-cluster NAD(P)-dependent oxidoreductase n=1 Tax=Shewanella sp. Scap07 TaxID=2589987 RepID=UPI0015B9A7E9|nr:hybrid-cluster NAD(P)-dependent oxidoreductase [Shewanella sp. Scap07]QLE84613.1 hybrid-cluster NAD(P)-dependent oxidoreductase [Shewanella sp. Scap07]
MNSQLLNSATWQHGEVRLVCVERWHETHDVVSYRFQAEQPVKFQFKPGQFITLLLDIQGERVARSYTISSSPSRPYSIVVTIKSIADGLVSNYLANNLQVGHRVLATGPDGVFNLVDIETDKYLFLSAGSGITPMYSMSRWLEDTQKGSDVAFLHSAKSTRDLVFHRDLKQFEQHNQNFHLAYTLEEGELQDGSSVTAGRFSIKWLTEQVADFQSRTIFVCGPAPYMDAVKAQLQQAGFDMSRFYQESFGGAPTATASSPSDDAKPFMLHISDKQIELSLDQSLLDGIEKLGLPIIAACRSGVCGACKCKVIKGEVESSSQMALTSDEIEQGYVLACSTKIRSDALVEL